MKIKVITVFIFLLACVSSFAQSSTYADGMQFAVEGKTYVVDDSLHPFFSIQNVQNELADRSPIDLNGNEVSPFDIEAGRLGIPSLRAALMATFTTEELTALRDAALRLHLYLTIDNQGVIKDVVFLFYRNAAVSLIPPEKIALLEHNLKSYINYELSESEKDLQFFHCSFPLNLVRLIPQYTFKGDRTDGEVVEDVPNR